MLKRGPKPKNKEAASEDVEKPRAELQQEFLEAITEAIEQAPDVTSAKACPREYRDFWLEAHQSVQDRMLIKQ